MSMIPFTASPARDEAPATALVLRTAGTLHRLAMRGVPLLFPALVLVAWELAARYELVSPQILPPPAEVFAIGRSMIEDGELPNALLVSFGRVLLGFSFGAVLGIVVGGAMGLSRTVETYLGPTIRAICLVPTIGWLPFFMLIFGIGEGLKIAIIIKGCFQPFAITTLGGVRSVSARYHDVARVLEFGRWRALTQVIVPAVLPQVFSGGRLALGDAWMVLVTAEMLASSEGIGYIMSWARLQFQLDVLLVALIAVGLAGWLLDSNARRLERRVGNWYGHDEGGAGTPVVPQTLDWRGLVLPAILLVLWSASSAAGFVNPRIVVAPFAVVQAAIDGAASGDLGRALLASLGRFAVGWTAGVAIGLSLGLLLGLSSFSRRFVGGSFHAVRQIALFAWIPLLTAWLGPGDAARIVFIAMAAAFPVALNTEAGCLTVPVRLREVAKVLEFGTLRTIVRVVLPAAAVSILAGIQLSLISGWIATVGSEYLIDTGVGLGITLSAARSYSDMATVTLGILLLGVFGLLLNRLGRALAQRFLPAIPQ